jgi:hypothetical protein
MTGDDRKAAWQRVFNTPPPLALNLAMSRLALAYDFQARISGRLRASST